jgi:hypothetical protein
MINDKISSIKPTRFGPASLLEIITGLSEDAIDSKADHKGEDGSAETLNLLIGALFGHLAAGFYQESQRKTMKAKGTFRKTEIPIDGTSMTTLMELLPTFVPEISEFAFTDDLVDGVEGPFWTLRDTNPKTSLNVGSWLRTLMMVSGPHVRKEHTISSPSLKLYPRKRSLQPNAVSTFNSKRKQTVQKSRKS